MPDGSASLESAVLRARASLAPNGLAAMRADAERAVALEPPGSPWHTMASLLHGSACLLLGDRDDAVQEFERAARLGREDARPGSSFALGQLALLAVDEGDWPTAASCAYDARALIDSAGLETSVTSLPAYAACALVALHRGNVQAARIDAAVALRLYRRPSPVAFPWLAAQMAIRLGRLLLEFDDPAGAQRKAIDAGRYLPLLGTATVLTEQHHQLVAELDRVRTRVVSDGTTLTARRAPHPPAAADPPLARRDRPAARPVPQHRQDAGRRDLSQARRDQPYRGGAAGDRSRPVRPVGTRRMRRPPGLLLCCG